MKSIFLTLCLGLFLVSCGKSKAQSFAIGKDAFELNGKPFVIRSGEMHHNRIPRAEWRDRLKMAKAMGLNTVCAYLFWNVIEPQPDKFNWEGNNDVLEFCKIAQEEGLYAILRPGPYSCAEWEFGGFPWWLLKDKSMKVRTQHPYFLARAKKYLMEVGRELASQQIDHGGNILMVQVENEYGSYGSDKEYMLLLKKYLEEAGFTVPLFHCDGPVQLKNDHPEGLFAVVNFGSNPAASFEALRKIQPTGPLMCGEYYPGWFDSWGRPHHHGDTERIVKELKYMLDHKASFSIYMAHGGTSFGTYSGANAPPFLPQTSSYDYDAPINEAGNPTEKFFAIRELFKNYLQEGETLPDVPATKIFQKPGAGMLLAVAELENNLPPAVASAAPMLMEDLGQNFGCVLYETTLKAGGEASLRFEAVHDYALIYLNDVFIGTIDRRKNRTEITIPAHPENSVLKILVEAVGRVNYGSMMHDRKGIHGQVFVVEGETKTEPANWKNYPIQLGDQTIPLNFLPAEGSFAKKAAFYKGRFLVDDLLPTYLDMTTWTKGLVWINGKCLGRFWNIGPTQTMLIPPSWLKKGDNEVMVFDLFPNHNPQFNFLSAPILDAVNEPQPQAHRTANQEWKLSKSQARFSGTFEAGDKWQSVGLKKPVAARYFCLEAVSNYSQKPFASIAEIVLTDRQGKEIPRKDWKIIFADSEELLGDDGSAANVLDMQFTSFWHTQWQNTSPAYPHQIVIDLGKSYPIGGMKILPRQDNDNGRIKDYNLYFSETPFVGL